MKAYGIPRYFELEFEDLKVIVFFARKSSIGHCKEKCGQYKSCIKNSRTKKRIRRYFKKKARKEAILKITKERL